MPEPHHADIAPRTEPRPGVRYTSGLAIHDEELAHGRWIGRYWAANGFIEPERNLATLGDRFDIPYHAFELNIDGQAMHFGWDHVETEVEARPGAMQATVRLRHQVRPVDLHIHTLSDGSGLLKRWLRITNTGDQPAALAAVMPWAGVLARVQRWDQTPGQTEAVFSVGYFDSGQWGEEGAFRWHGLPPGGFHVESRIGWSGHGNPFFVLRNNLTGQQFVSALAWSGNWRLNLYQVATPSASGYPLPGGEATVWFSFGPSSPGPMRVIEPGETIETPAVHLGCIDGDLDETLQAYHDHLRRSVLPATPLERRNLVTWNHWSYSNDELSEQALRHEVTVAAEVGAEMFIVDAGWYADQGVAWHQRVGDWDEGNRIGCGLGGIFDYARSKGLKCGLWVDIERIGTESKIAQEHPEWMTTLYGDVPMTAVNTAIPEAGQYIEGKLAEIIERYQLDLFRLDRNVHVWENGQNLRAPHELCAGYLENVTFRHYEFVYGMYRRLRERFPHLIMENCAGGGGRHDLGMMGLFDHTQSTDWPRSPRHVRIFNGMSMCLPPERIMTIGLAGQDGHERADLDFIMRSLIFGHLYMSGLRPPGATANPAQVERVKHAVELYKSVIRPMLPTSQLYHHTPELPGLEPSGWCVWELVSEDRQQAVVGLFRLAGQADPDYLLRFRGLDQGRDYGVTFDNTGSTAAMSGARLSYEGLTIRLDKPLSSELLILNAEHP